MAAAIIVDCVAAWLAIVVVAFLFLGSDRIDPAARGSYAFRLLLLPVFITTPPLHGTRYLLIDDPRNHALPDALRDYVAITSRMDGTLERIGDALVFRTDVTRTVVP